MNLIIRGLSTLAGMAVLGYAVKTMKEEHDKEIELAEKKGWRKGYDEGRSDGEDIKLDELVNLTEEIRNLRKEVEELKGAK